MCLSVKQAGKNPEVKFILKGQVVVVLWEFI